MNIEFCTCTSWGEKGKKKNKEGGKIGVQLTSGNNAPSKNGFLRPKTWPVSSSGGGWEC